MHLRNLLLCIVFFTSLVSSAQDNDSLDFPILVFNPYENYHFVSFNKMLTSPEMSDFTFEQYEYLAPFGLGIRKDIVEKGTYQLSVTGSINVQFIFRNEKSDLLNGIRKTHFNTDFFLRLHNTFSLSNHDKIRATLYHRSSHLGDDYAILNEIPSLHYWEKDEANYEALKIQYAFEKTKILLYAGTQIILRIDSPRKRLEFHQGLVYRNFFKGDFGKKIFFGYDIKFLENNGYNPDLDLGFGYYVGKTSQVRLNYFNGNISFSRLENQEKTSWIGLGFYIPVSSL